MLSSGVPLLYGSGDGPNQKKVAGFGLFPGTIDGCSIFKHPSYFYTGLTGAGTGKTTAITGKIAWMIEKQKIKPEKILALTFSREAARNMEKIVYVQRLISLFK
jgi:hypothetical protein